MIKKYKYLLVGAIVICSFMGMILVWVNFEKINKITQNTHKQIQNKELKEEKKQVFYEESEDSFKSKSEVKLIQEEPKEVFQVILGKKYYDKKSANDALQAFLDKHPYNNHNFKSAEEWKAIPKKDRPDLAME